MRTLEVGETGRKYLSLERAYREKYGDGSVTNESIRGLWVTAARRCGNLGLLKDFMDEKEAIKRSANCGG